MFLFLFSVVSSVDLQAQTYRLSRVRPSRYEVTKRLDANLPREAEEFLASYKSCVDSLRLPFVGMSESFMYAYRPESPLSNWVADVLKWAGEQQGFKIDMGLCNIGGLRAAMPKDTVRIGDIMAITPFENVLSIVKMRGSDLTHLFENIAYAGGEGVSRGVCLVINTKSRSLVSAEINGNAVDPNAFYVIATLDYLSDGNDKMIALKNAVERKDIRIPVRDLTRSYFAYLNARGEKASACVEGRVKDEAGAASKAH
ncbi:MAG: 5'-nucleotidase C-terminal domain-containing protein [Bacteroidaceae bacterium]|nr:5'-nucleotidase C-terminal domain-containing protein [Bacteroidaceae bacterium]